MKRKLHNCLRIGVIGCGIVSERKHLPALRKLPNVAIAAVADIDPVRRERVGQRYSIDRRYRSAEELLEQTDIDAVIVATPPSEHVTIAIDALRCGKHVLVEKPLALTRSDCDELIEEASASSAIAMTGFHMRWHRLIEEGRRIVRSGALGDIESVRTVWSSALVKDEPLLPWRYERQSGGGALIELGVHQYDLWRYLVGSNFSEVSAFCSARGRADDTATVTAVLENGVLASTVVSEQGSHEIVVEVCGRDARLRMDCLRYDGLHIYPFAGDPGSVSSRLGEVRSSLIHLPQGFSSYISGGDYADSYRRQIEQFMQAIESRSAPGCSLLDGKQAVLTALAASRSAESGRCVTLEDAPNEFSPVPYQVTSTTPKLRVGGRNR